MSKSDLRNSLRVQSAARTVGAVVFSAAMVAACHRASTPSSAGANASRDIVTALQGAPPTCVAAAPSVASLANTPVENPVATFDSAWARIERTHWDPKFNGANWGAVRDSLRPKAQAARTTGELRAVLNAMVGTLKQSHFSIIPREVSDATPASASKPADHNGGIGVKLRDLDGVLVVADVRDGSPAFRAGIKPGFVVDAIDGCPLAPKLARIPPTPDARRLKLSAWSVGNALVAGAVGDSVRITWRNAKNALVTTQLVREPEPGSVEKFGNLPPLNAFLEYERRQVDGKTVGIIRFNIWMPALSQAFDKAIDALRDADAIVLDLRGNFGGVGGMAMGIAGHFLDSAINIGTMEQRGSSLKFVANPRRVNTRSERVTPYAGPLAIVVDELSISTTEIFAGGMQSIGRARVFGAQTSGQALPAVAERLPNADILYHAIANFLSPSGKAVEGDGVIPDVSAPLTRKALLDGHDPALESAMGWAAALAGKKPAATRVTP